MTHLDVSDSPRVSDETFDRREGPGQNLTTLTRFSLRRSELTDHVLRRMLFPDMFPARRVSDLRGTQVRESSLGDLNRHRPQLGRRCEASPAILDHEPVPAVDEQPQPSL